MSSDGPSANAVRRLANRVLTRVGPLEVDGLEGRDVPGYAYTADAGVLRIAATDTVAACAGLYAYLKEVCGIQVTWDSPLPLVTSGVWPDAPRVERTTPAVHRYYLNVVTTGYSAPFWDWDRWQREIDWMALHGVTTPLMMVAHEAILTRAFLEHGADLEEVRCWLGSAAHLPWTLMGCTNGLGGPVPREWFRRRLALARQILDRQRELGMRAVLPSFDGHVPDSLAGPRAERTAWQGFETALLTPADPAFASLAKAVAAAQAEMFGTDHLYSADPFIESIPPSGATEDLAAHTHAIYAGMAASDPEAVWVMQAWPFHYHRQFWTAERISAVTAAVPEGRLLLLDLWADHAPVWGDGREIEQNPWLWSAVHNFGGRFSMHGDLRGLSASLGDVLDMARAGAARVGRFMGTGLAMEAIENNPVFYELATDLVWETPELTTWVRGYVERRYQLSDAPSAVQEAARDAWDRLLATLYRPGTSRSIPSPLIARPWDIDPPFARQRTAGEFIDPDAPVLISANIDAESDPRVEGDLEAIALVVERLLVVASSARMQPLVADIVDVLTHLVGQRCRAVIRGISAAARARRPAEVASRGAILTGALLDLDRLVATCSDRILGTWLRGAASWGADADERAVLVRDARRLLSVWAYQTSGLHDYSGRHWSGMLAGYYLPRWQLWVEWLTSAAEGGGEDPAAFRSAVVDLEEGWANESTIGETEPAGDLVGVATELLERYREPLV